MIFYRLYLQAGYCGWRQTQVTSYEVSVDPLCYVDDDDLSKNQSMCSNFGGLWDSAAVKQNWGYASPFACTAGQFYNASTCWNDCESQGEEGSLRGTCEKYHVFTLNVNWTTCSYLNIKNKFTPKWMSFNFDKGVLQESLNQTDPKAICVIAYAEKNKILANDPDTSFNVEYFQDCKDQIVMATFNSSTTMTVLVSARPARRLRPGFRANEADCKNGICVENLWVSR
jgi:hypothetical protein